MTMLGDAPYQAEPNAYERQLLAARAQLGEATFAAAWAAGRAMNLEQAIAYALDADADPSGPIPSRALR